MRKVFQHSLTHTTLNTTRITYSVHRALTGRIRCHHFVLVEQIEAVKWESTKKTQNVVYNVCVCVCFCGYGRWKLQHCNVEVVVVWFVIRICKRCAGAVLFAFHVADVKMVMSECSSIIGSVGKKHYGKSLKCLCCRSDVGEVELRKKFLVPCWYVFIWSMVYCGWMCFFPIVSFEIAKTSFLIYFLVRPIQSRLGYQETFALNKHKHRNFFFVQVT